MRLLLAAARDIARRPKRSFIYFFGRFHLVRKINKLIVSFFGTQIKIPSPKEAVEINTPDFESSIEQLRNTALLQNIILREPVLQEILNLVETSYSSDAATGRSISIIEAKQHNLDNNKNKILMLNHKSPSLDRCVQKIACSPLLVDIATRYLGRIKAIETRVQTSLATHAPTEYRERCHQTVMFHYDVHALGFLYAFFYLSDCNEMSGAHEMIRCSHKSKPWKFLISTARRSDEDIYTYYPGKSIIISGNKGTGFVEDTSCFHRALPPISGDRLALQIRYSA